MNFLIGIPLMLLAMLAAILLTVFVIALRFFLKMRKYMRGDFTDEEVERFSKKYHRDSDTFKFDRDYFKRSTGNAQSGSGQRDNSAQRGSAQRDSGVIIIDDRDPRVATRKIFTEGEGEYVDFKEV